LKKIISIITIVFSLAIAAVSQPPQAAATPEKPAAVYADLVKKVAAGDTSVDFKAMRMAYTETDDYSSYGMDSATRSKMFQLLDQKKYKEALDVAADELKTNYVEMNAHIVSSIAYRGLGETAKADFHKAVYLGLVNSVVVGVTGDSAKSAYTVISVPEEYVIVSALGLRRSGQALQNENGHKYDVLTVMDPETNKTRSLYFNIDIVWKGYDKLFKN